MIRMKLLKVQKLVARGIELSYLDITTITSMVLILGIKKIIHTEWTWKTSVHRMCLRTQSHPQLLIMKWILEMPIYRLFTIVLPMLEMSKMR